MLMGNPVVVTVTVAPVLGIDADGLTVDRDRLAVGRDIDRSRGSDGTVSVRHDWARNADARISVVNMRVVAEDRRRSRLRADCQKSGEVHHTKTQQAIELVHQVAQWLPDKPLELVTDSA